MPKIFCSSCGKKYNIKNELLGRKVKCRNCGEVFTAEAGEKVNDVKSNNDLKIPVPDRKGSTVSKTMLLSFILLSVSLIVLIYASSTYYPVFVFSKVIIDAGTLFYYSPLAALAAYILWITILKRKKGTWFLCFAMIFSSVMLVKGVGILLEQPPEYTPEELTITGRQYNLPGTTAEPLLNLLNESTRKDPNEKNYEAEIQKLGLLSTLSPSRLTTVDGIKKARRKLSDYDLILNEYEESFNRKNEILDRKIEELGMPESQQKEILGSYLENKKYGRQKIDELFSNRKAFASEWNRYLDFLEEINGKYTILKGQISCSSQEDEKKNGEFINSLNDISTKEVYLINSISMYRAAKLEEMKKMLDPRSFK